MVLVEGVGDVCADDLVLSLEDGQLYVAGTEPSPSVMVWDGEAAEWVAIEEYNRREAARAERRDKVRAAAEAAEGAEGIQRERQVFDVVAGEWVAPSEYEERRQRRASAARVVRDRLGSGALLPNLGRVAGLRVKLDTKGVAHLGDRPAADVLVEEEAEEEGAIDLVDLREAFAPTGPLGRAEEADKRKRLIWLALLAAIVAALALRTRGTA
jgi:hypothetical protein